MAVTAITLTNADAEVGNTSGWTRLSGSTAFTNIASDGAVTPHGGSRFFKVGPSATSQSIYYQTVNTPGAIDAAIDAGSIAVKYAAWNYIGSSGNGARLYIECYSGAGATGTLLLTHPLPYIATTGVWQQLADYTYLPAGTRSIRLHLQTGTEAASGFNSLYWDDITLDYSDDPETDWPADAFVNQLGLYSLGSQPADEALVNQLGVQVVAAAETSNTFHDVKVHQLGLYALVKPNADRENLRAWQFPQDDHVFYVLQLSQGLGTIVYDSLSQQWSEWKSPDYDLWRGADGMDWAGINVCCDVYTGKLWQIDADNRLDYGTTPIESVIVGGMTERFRNFVPMYMAELALSEGEPPIGIDASTVGISLRVGDGKGNWVDHGEITGEDIGEDITVRWYGLGLSQSPGTIFEITDTGYARRIDALNVEVGE